MSTVPMIAPDGSTADVPLESVGAALKAGAKQAALMVAPDGSKAHVPFDAIPQARQAGAKLASEMPTQFEQNPTPAKQSIGSQIAQNVADPYIGAAKSAVKTGLGAIGMVQPALAPAMESAAQSPALQTKGAVQKIGAGAETAAELALPGAAGAGKIAESIPSAERAMGAFQDVAQVANKMPVELKNANAGLNELLNWQRSTNLGPTVNKFIARVTNPNLGDLTYEEARRFYQLFGQMSVNENLNMPPAVRFALNQMRAGLKTDIGNAAALADKSTQYYSAMKEFANAKTLEGISDATKSTVIDLLKKAAQGTLLATGFKYGGKILDELK